MKRMFYKSMQSIDFDPRAIARSAERVAEAKARADAETEAYNRGLERIKNGGFMYANTRK
jgi:hypothetical protein